MSWQFALTVLKEKYSNSGGMQVLMMLHSFAESSMQHAMQYVLGSSTTDGPNHQSPTANDPHHRSPTATPYALFAHEDSTELFLLVILPVTVSFVAVHCVFRNMLASFMLALQLTLAYGGALHLRAFAERALSYNEF